MYNKVTLVGNFTRDVEIRQTQNGSAIGNVGIATSRKYKTQSGEQKDEVMFIDLALFGRTAEIASKYLAKGSKVLIDGRLTLNQWTAQDGTKKSKHVVTVESLQMLDSKKDNNQQGNNQNQQNQHQQGNNQNQHQQAQQNQQNQQNQHPQAQQNQHPQQNQYSPQTQQAPQTQQNQYSQDELPF